MPPNASHHTSNMTFGTILVARSKDQPASPLEQSLRTCSQRLRVVSRLSGEAHLVINEEKSTTLAVQVFDAERMEEMERRWKEEAGRGGGGGGRPGEDWMLTKAAAAANSKKKNFNPLKDDPTILALKTFRDTFRNTAIFFVLGPPHGDLRRRQMTRPASFLNVAQRALASPRCGSAGGGNGTGNSSAMGSSRIFLVSDVASLQSHLRTTIDSIRPDKIQMKEKFFAEQCRLNLLPPKQQGAEVDSRVVAQRVADALRAWSDGAGIPRGEMDVLLGMLGSLEAVATADGRALADIPVSDRTKQMIVTFFSSPLPSSTRTTTLGEGDEERLDEVAMGGVERMGRNGLMDHQPEQPNFTSSGGWTAGDESGVCGMGFSGHVVGANTTTGSSRGGVDISEMQSFVGGGKLGGEGPRQFHQAYGYQGNGGGVAAGYSVDGGGGYMYCSNNAWHGGQQPHLSGANPRAQSYDWMYHGKRG